MLGYTRNMLKVGQRSVVLLRNRGRHLMGISMTLSEDSTEVTSVTSYSQTRYLSSRSTSSSTKATRPKMSYFHGGGSTELLGITIGQLLEKKAEEIPDAEAVVVMHQNVRMTFQQVLEESDKFAAGLIALGMQRGDRIGIWSPNNIEWIITQFAAARAGLIIVNVNPAYQANELLYCLQKVGMKAIVMPESFKTQKYHELLSKVCPEMGNSPPGPIKSSALPDLKLVIMLGEKQYSGALRFSDVMKAGGKEQFSYISDLQYKIQFDDPVNVQFTSGTTGSPKGACLTHHNVINNARLTGMRQDLHLALGNGRVCIPVPLYHCFGMVMGSLQMILHNTVCVFPSPSHDPEATLKAVHKERCTALYGTPTMFVDILNHPSLEKYNLKSLSTGIMSGAPCPVELLKQVMEKLNMTRMTICYGATEFSPVGFQTLPTDSIQRRVETVGKLHPNVEVKLIDSEGLIVPIGTPGEVCFRGYGVMLGYWGDQEKTSEVIGKDRWYKTGDIGVLDEDGYMKIIGRSKDMILRGGENIYPAEIEQFLHTHPKISDAHVIGVPDNRLGEQVAAWIRLKNGVQATEQEIKDFCKGQIAHFKIPYYVTFVKEYPMTVTNKVQKYKMRELAKKMYNIDD